LLPQIDAAVFGNRHFIVTDGVDDGAAYVNFTPEAQNG
jgi:hypothetical protein